jgi:hypothetical protein
VNNIHYTHRECDISQFERENINEPFTWALGSPTGSSCERNYMNQMQSELQRQLTQRFIKTAMQQMIECLNNFHHIDVKKMCQKLPKIKILTSTIYL